ncbi:MAG: hypothetical protein PHY99_03640 [Bacteroidales bacterium]|nr:hypothetical protein [Bacteroidales bacterium]
MIGEYKAEPLIKSETQKSEQQKQLIADYRHKLMEGDQLIIRNNNLNFSFNPNEKLIPIDNFGVVYKTLRLTGDWGILEVRDGILRSNDWQLFIISAPKATTGKITEAGYDLQLSDGWEVVMIKEGKYTIRKK